MAKDVSIPSEVPMPSMVMNSAKGASPAGGGPFFLSVTARTAMRKTAVAMNSEKKHDTDVM